jgi:dTDP-4-amino-4,6-dideoxygalactose transaminase
MSRTRTIPFADLHRQYLALKKEIDTAMAEVIRESAFIRGPHVEVFEKKFAKLIGVSHCVSCANGTDAIYITLKGLGIGPGDEVITTAHSWISTSETITQAGAQVVFVDTEPDTFCIDTRKIEKKITKKTKAIIPVHLYGHPADMDPILVLAKKYDLKVIEDCAQAHLAKYKGRTVGTLGDAATFSFYPGKNLGAMGDAGCITTNNESLAEFCATFARHGGKNEHVMEGINSRMDGLQAAILNVKMDHLLSWNEERKKIAAHYNHELSKVPGLICPTVRENCEHVYHLYVIQHPRRDELRKHLERKGISTLLNYPKALPFYLAYARLGKLPKEFPTAYTHQQTIISLPIFPFMSESEITAVTDAIQNFHF